MYIVLSKPFLGFWSLWLSRHFFFFFSLTLKFSCKSRQMLQIHITIVGRRGKPRLRAGIMLCSHMRNPLPRIASQGFLSWHDNLPPVLSVSESCLWLLCLLVLICLSFRWLIQRQRLQRLKGMNSSLPFFDPSIGETVPPGCLTNHEIRCTIYWFSETFFFFFLQQAILH